MDKALYKKQCQKAKEILTKHFGYRGHDFTPYDGDFDDYDHGTQFVLCPYNGPENTALKQLSFLVSLENEWPSSMSKDEIEYCEKELNLSLFNQKVFDKTIGGIF